jgi:hypothetical protein
MFLLVTNRSPLSTNRKLPRKEFLRMTPDLFPTKEKESLKPSKTKRKTASPRRIAANRANSRKRKGFTPKGLQKVRASTLKHRPWQYSTGPKTPEGRRQSALNGKRRQKGPISVREARRQVAALAEAFNGAQEARQMVYEALSGRNMNEQDFAELEMLLGE